MSISLFPYLDRIFTQPGVEVELSSLSVQTPCQLRVLAVGGGGNGALGGGGSGYVQYFSQALTSTPSNIKLTETRSEMKMGFLEIERLGKKTIFIFLIN